MTMKITNIYTTEDHNTFGGTIRESDFNTTYPGTHNIVNRIVANWKFDDSCKSIYNNKNNIRKDEYTC